MRVTRVFFAAMLIAAGVLITAVMLDSPPVRASDAPPEVLAGFGVWRDNGCESCHTLYGQGGTYAPDLTHIYSQRGEAYLRAFLVNPQAFHPGQRVMPNMGLTVSETDQLLQFLDWVGDQRSAVEFPPRLIRVSGGDVSGLTDLLPAPNASAADVPPTDVVANGRYWFSRPPAICSTCHSLTPDVVLVGPSLAGIATRAADRVPGQSAEAYLRNSILHPGDYVVDGFNNVMAQNLGEVLDSDQINNIIAFLLTLE